MEKGTRKKCKFKAPAWPAKLNPGQAFVLGRWQALLLLNMRPKFLFVYKFLIAFILLGPCLYAQEDHLKPTNGIFGLHDFEFDYYSKVREVLFDSLDDNPAVRFLVLPSFSPEYVLDIDYDRDSDKYYLKFHICEKQIWDNEKLNRTKVISYHKEISNESAEIIKGLFRQATLGIKLPDKELMGLDGTNYYFSYFNYEINNFGMRSGTIWSPPEGSKMNRLVHICESLIVLSKNQDKIIELSAELKRDVSMLTEALK